MKRCSDNFSSYYGNAHHLGIVSGASSHAETNLLMLPEDVILELFANFSESTLRQLSLVCRAWNVYAKNDFLWHNIAESILFSHEMKAKPEKTTFKNYAKEWLSSTHVGHLRHFLKPRDSVFMNNLKQMKLPDFKVLSPSETHALVRMKNTIQLIEAVEKDIPDFRISLHYAAQQQVGAIKFDLLNGSPYVINFDSKRNILINNKLTEICTTRDDCQALILIRDDHLHIYLSYIGEDRITEFYCSVDDLALDDPKQIAWEENTMYKNNPYSSE